MGKSKTQPDKQKIESKGLQIKPASILKLLTTLALIQFLINLIAQFLVFNMGMDESSLFIELFDMDRETSIPSLYSVFLLFSIFLLLLVISLLKRKEKAAHVAGWFILALGFLFMTFDEGASIHELLMRPVHRLLIYEEIPSIFYFTWVIPAILLVALLALLYLKFMIDLPAETRRLFLLSAVIYLMGVIGAELAAGYYAGKFGTENPGFNLLASVEESLEMMGLILFIHALLTYMAKQYGEIQLNFISRKIKR